MSEAAEAKLRSAAPLHPASQPSPIYLPVWVYSRLGRLERFSGRLPEELIVLALDYRLTE